MAEHPEFPQESPATKYIIDQVSKIEDAHACSTGYYKSLGKVLSRLDKTDTLLVQLQQNSTALKNIVDTDAVAVILGKKSDDINDTLREGMTNILDGSVAAVSNKLCKIAHNYQVTNAAVAAAANEISETNKKLDRQIRDLSGCLIISSWKLFGYLALVFFAGVYFGGMI